MEAGFLMPRQAGVVGARRRIMLTDPINRNKRSARKTNTVPIPLRTSIEKLCQCLEIVGRPGIVDVNTRL